MKATQARLRELFDYNPETGIMVRRIGVQGTWAGRVVGTLGSKGYLKVCIDREYCEVHRVVWKWLYGVNPVQVDHVNRIRHDNRQINLREATPLQNQGNRKVTASSGFKGVSTSRKGKPWRASLAGRHLGVFDTPEEAAESYRAAAVKHFGLEFVHAP